MGYEPRAELPIYIAALSPNMLQLAGEIGDGVMLWLCNPDYIRDVVVPEVTEGRERAGKPLEGFDVVAAVPVGAHRRPRGRPRDACARTSSPTPRSPSTARCSSARASRPTSPPSTRAWRPGDPEQAKAGLSDADARLARRHRRRRARSRARSSATATPARPPLRGRHPRHRLRRRPRGGRRADLARRHPVAHGRRARRAGPPRRARAARSRRARRRARCARRGSAG